LIEPHSVTSRKYLTAADSIMGKNPCNPLAPGCSLKNAASHV
jgi:hypothetical protein